MGVSKRKPRHKGRRPERALEGLETSKRVGMMLTFSLCEWALGEGSSGLVRGLRYFFAIEEVFYVN